MPQDHDDHVSRRHALECMIWTGTGVLWTVSGGVPKSLSLLGRAEAATATAQTKPTIPIIVKDTTSFYWQTVLAGARKAGQDLGVNVSELGAQSESDINGQISILESAVSSNPAAVVIAPTQFAALGKPIEEAAKKIKIIGIDSAADTKAFTSVLTTDNVQAGRIAADILAERIQKTYADAEGDVALITSLPGVASLDQRAKGFKEQLAAKYGALSIVAEKVADGQASTGRNIMTEIIAAKSRAARRVRLEPDHGARGGPGRSREQDEQDGGQDQSGRLRLGRTAHQIPAGRYDRRPRCAGPVPDGL